MPPEEPDISFTSDLQNMGLPPEVEQLATALAMRHGSVLVSKETGGLHLNMACPHCLDSEGRRELTKRHLAVNAEKYWQIGKWNSGGHSRFNRTKDNVAKCMKCDRRFMVTDLLAWPTLSQRNIQDSRVGKVNFVDNTAWLVQDVYGNIIPGGPGDGSPNAVIPVNQLPEDHPAVYYLRQRHYDLNTLVDQFGCSYCAQEWAENRQARRYYRKLPMGFRDSPQGRLIFFAYIEGVQRSWQQRLLDIKVPGEGWAKQVELVWNGVTSFKWEPVRGFDGANWHLFPGYDGEPEWSPSKYRTASGTQRNQVLFGYDAAVRWNRLHRPDKPPIVFSLEGPLDAGRLGPPAVAQIGKYLSDEQVALYAKQFSIVVLVPDLDEAGQKNVPSSVQRLKKAGLQVYILELSPTVLHNGVNLPIKDTGDLPPSVAALIKDQWLAYL